MKNKKNPNKKTLAFFSEMKNDNGTYFFTNIDKTKASEIVALLKEVLGKSDTAFLTLNTGINKDTKKTFMALNVQPGKAKDEVF